MQEIGRVFPKPGQRPTTSRLSRVGQAIGISKEWQQVSKPLGLGQAEPG